MNRATLLNNYKSLSINKKFIALITFIVLIIVAVNIFLLININAVINRMDEIYDSNVRLNELMLYTDQVSDSLENYLNTKSTESMGDYYEASETLIEISDELNSKATSDRTKLAEKNIKNLINSYLLVTDRAVEAKRGRNIEKYKAYFDEASVLHGFITDAIVSLNNESFKVNAKSYMVLSESLRVVELLCFAVFGVTALIGIILVTIVSNTITTPLRSLSAAAQQVSEGNYDVELKETGSKDEVAVVTHAFNTMTDSIKDNIIRLRENLENEQKMKEKELLMEAHLKDAQLKYLQAQINPHFLFNTLNAGAQLAMMEDADRTYEYIQQVASFFRYNIKKDYDAVPLLEEIAMVDTYIYILNVRFAGEIGYEKEVDESLLDIKVPLMCLQPIVENAVNYGIRDIDYEGRILLSVYKNGSDICISIKDNGVGMTKERIEEVLMRNASPDKRATDSNGIGLDNVMSRLELLYGEKGVLDIVSEGMNMGTEVILRIPGGNEDV